jgi:hypothetical protein
MSLKRVIECEDRREFARLSMGQVDFADKITVGGTVVKNRPATGAPARA